MSQEPTSAQVSEQIARLQQRQLELVQHTAQELEDLKRKLQHSEEYERRSEAEKAPLLEEINRLKATLYQAEQDKQHLQKQLLEQQTQLQTQLEAVRNAVRGSVQALDQHMRAFSSDATHSLEHMTRSLESIDPSASTLPAPFVAPELPTIVEAAPLLPMAAPVTQKPAKVKKEKNRTLPSIKVPRLGGVTKKLRPLAVRTVQFALIAAIGYAGWNKLMTPPSPDTLGQVAGVSTTSLNSAPSTSVPTSDYTESFADIPFEETTWTKSTNTDFGLTIEYPSNTTNMVYTVGTNNLWFLRKSGYLLKITREDFEGSLDGWIDENREDLEADNTLSKSTFKGQPAWLIKQQVNSRTNNSGYQYAIKRDNKIFLIWIKEEDPTSPDGQRIARMISGLEFMNTP